MITYYFHFSDKGQAMEAMELFPTALRELPDSPSINFVGANILGKLNRYEEAERYFKKAIYLFGERVQPVHYANLGKHILHSTILI